MAALENLPIPSRNPIRYRTSRESSRIRGRRQTMNEHGESSHHTAAPASFGEMVAALKALNQPEREPLGKHVATIVIAVVLGLGAYVVSGVANMQSSVATIQATVSQSKDTLDGVQKDIKTLADQQGDLRTQQAELKQRVESLERARGVTSR